MKFEQDKSHLKYVGSSSFSVIDETTDFGRKPLPWNGCQCRNRWNRKGLTKERLTHRYSWIIHKSCAPALLAIIWILAHPL